LETSFAMARRNVKNDWNDAVESWADFVRCRKDYYRDELNNPASFKLIGNLRGQLVLDLACGEGYNTRMLARKGAKAIGVDFSKEMIRVAEEEEAKERLGICYRLLDASQLKDLPNEHFDIVTCFMSLQDIENCQKAISEVARVLKRHGRFIFSIPHPCFETIVVDDRRIGATRRYFKSVRYTVQWKSKRLLRPFKTTAFHRTLTDYSNALFRNKLLISRIVEPIPTRKGLRKHCQLREVLMRPQSMIVECTKIHARPRVPADTAHQKV